MNIISSNNKISLNLYCDEIKESTIQHKFFKNEKWAYIGILIVPCSLEDDLIERLLNKRCGNTDGNKIWKECQNRCNFHKKITRKFIIKS